MKRETILASLKKRKARHAALYKEACRAFLANPVLHRLSQLNRLTRHLQVLHSGSLKYRI